MAVQPNTRRAASKPLHSAEPSAAIKEPTQRIRGYILSETAEYKLRTISDALAGIAMLTEGEAGNEMPEMPSSHLAAIFRLIGEATDNIRNSAEFAVGEGQVVPRTLN